MIEWEYMHVEAFHNRVIKVNNSPVGDTSYKDIATKINFNNYELIMNDFLEAVGHSGWEVAGMCSASDDGKSWRIILKRTVPE